MTISSRNWLGRYAAQYAIAEASGGTPPTLKNNGIVNLGQWENSVSGKEPECDPSARPGNVVLEPDVGSGNERNRARRLGARYT